MRIMATTKTAKDCTVLTRVRSSFGTQNVSITRWYCDGKKWQRCLYDGLFYITFMLRVYISCYNDTSGHKILKKKAIETIGHTYLEIKPLCSDYKKSYVLGRAVAVVTVLLVKLQNIHTWILQIDLWKVKVIILVILLPLQYNHMFWD